MQGEERGAIRWCRELCAALVLLVGVGCASVAPSPQAPGLAPVPAEGVSLSGMFGGVEVVQEGQVRQLLFIDDEGDAAIQSEMDVLHPEALQPGYTRTMFASYFAVPAPGRVLIVGLGGGAMVRFLQAHAPDVEIDAVEIDPVVVEIAARYFGVRPGERTRIHCEDAFDYLDRSAERWDVIYMDAFIQPGEGTDVSGAPLHLSTAAFLRGLGGRLAPGGVVVFNLVEGESLEEQEAGVFGAFSQVWRFQAADSANVVLVASPGALPPSGPDAAVGAAVDARLKANFSVAALAREWVAP